MAAKHELSLEIIETGNPKLFRISDTSFYSSDIPVDCATLEILSPGFNTPAILENVIPGFNYMINACTLKQQTVDCSSNNFGTVADGVYVIRYSVSPNDKVRVEYNFLRMTGGLNLYYSKLAALNVKACEPERETKAILSEMRLIKSLFDAAKAKVEYCHTPREGLELYVYALKRLEKVCV
jgi:hypothetical protein